MRPPQIEPNDLLLFARVADLGSFSRAAEKLGLPKSTVSRRVSALESQLGERLLTRTTRKLTVTDFGQSVLEHARHVVEDVEAASSLAQNRQVLPSGRLRVTMPGDLGNLVLVPMLAEFALRYPAITLEIDLSARFVDLIGENFDVAIRMGDLRDDATLSARRIACFTLGLYASPAYLKKHGTPSKPDDLLQHGTLHVLSRTGAAMPWVLHRDHERWEDLPPVRALANSPELLMRMALEGAGIAMANDHFALPHVQRKELVCVLPEWRPAPVSAWAVFPGRRLMPTKTRVFIDALAERLTGPECQAAQAQVEKALPHAKSRSTSLRLRR
ncbi:MAG TPA: LysR family transcriptional regulator [Usitatibacter sp.]|jgi:DNA-binding transcriptional LysR family regulator|nr:LysR family transcriptional regulator [Usitatibacter sp.]